MGTSSDPGPTSGVIRTPDQRLRVFVSSTLQELADERAAVSAAIRRLHLVPVLFELGARPHPPRDLYRAYLAQSHVFVGIYWQRYGWVAPDMDISGLEDEYRLAGDHPKLVYIKHPAADREPDLEALLDRIRDDGTTSYRPFSTADELHDLVADDLAVMLTERFEASIVAPEPDVGVLAESVVHAPTPLVGREVEVQALIDLLLQGGARLVTITGPGGSGKTRLAIELCEILRRDHGQRVCFVDLTGLRSADIVLPTIASALGIREGAERSLIDAIAVVLADTSWILVIDNFEHVIDAAARIGELLSVTSDVKVLVTSRQALHLRWEQEYPLLPLDVPDASEHRSVDAVAAVPSVELLVQRAQRVRRDFALTSDNSEAVAEITRRLDGLPLAIELAAARLRVLTPADLLTRLEHRLDALATSSPDMPGRHRTLREAISWSHELLRPGEQILFRRMGVFAGSARLEAIETVCSGDGIDMVDVLDLLDGLVEKSLVTSTTDPSTGDMRFRLLETIREYAMEQLVEAGEAEATFDRHLDWAAALAVRGWSEIWTSNMRRWLDLLDREHDNLRLALDHAAGAGNASTGLRLAHSLLPLWDIRGHYREGHRRLTTLLDRADDAPSLERGRALDALGWLDGLMGNYEASRPLMQQGLAMVRATGTPLDLAWSLGEQGNVAFTLGLAEEARSLFSESLELARELGHTLLIGWNIFGLGYVALLDGDLEAMGTLLREALSYSREVYQPWAIAWAQFSLGIVSLMTGDLEAATHEVAESLDLRWSIRDARGTTESLGVLAALASARGMADDDEQLLALAALLHGANELQREANGLGVFPFLQPVHDESVARLSEGLGPERLDSLWKEGRALPLGKAVAEALAWGRAGDHEHFP